MADIDYIKQRLDRLESFKSIAEKAAAVAAALAIFLGYTFFDIKSEIDRTKAQSDLLLETVGDLNNELDQIRNDVDDATEKLKSVRDTYIAEIVSESSQTVASMRTELVEVESAMLARSATIMDGHEADLEEALKEHRTKLENTTPAALLESFKDGTQSINVRNLTITDDNGVTRAYLGATNSSLARLSFHYSSGQPALQTGITLSGNPYFVQQNAQGKRFTWIGQYDNTANAGIELQNPSSGASMAALSTTDTGGRLMITTADESAYASLVAYDNAVQQQFFHDANQRLSFGTYSPSGEPFFIGKNGNNQEILRISANNYGGTLLLRSDKGKQFVYAGPVKGGAHGMVRVDDETGDKTGWLSPKTNPDN